MRKLILVLVLSVVCPLVVAAPAQAQEDTVLDSYASNTYWNVERSPGTLFGRGYSTILHQGDIYVWKMWTRSELQVEHPRYDGRSTWETIKYGKSQTIYSGKTVVSAVGFDCGSMDEIHRFRVKQVSSANAGQATDRAYSDYYYMRRCRT